MVNGLGQPVGKDAAPTEPWYDRWIVMCDGKWVPVAEDYSNLGEYDTREEAVAVIEKYAAWLNSTSDHS